jgi:2-polyprenyl-3-methyl-5-hydroxy-6-metoxy-1,4-benzoquinol methylase
MLHTTTNNGLHEFVCERVLARFASAGTRAADLGSGPGAMAARLRSLGYIAVDRDSVGFAVEIPHISIDFNQADFTSQIGSGSFSLVTAIEVIEHVESPIGFLRNVRGLLAREGIAVITTPNLDSLPARLKYLWKGTIRTMDQRSEPTHISPIFLELFKRQFLPLAGLQLREHVVFPPGGYQLTRKALAFPLRLAASVFPGQALLGDNHIFVLEAKS